MKVDNILNYKNGWIVGDFEPSLIKSKEFDIGIVNIKKGFVGDKHFHLIHTEYNIIIQGQVLIYNHGVLSDGDIFIYNPKDKSELEFLEDTTILVIKSPATKNDKYYQ